MITNKIQYFEEPYQLEAIQSLTNSIDRTFSLDYIDDKKSKILSNKDTSFHKVKIASAFFFAMGVSNVIQSNKNLPTYSFDSYNIQSLSLYLTNNAFADYNSRKFSKILRNSNCDVKDDLVAKILSFKSLINSWDGFGAIPLEIQSASNAINLINKLTNNIVDLISDIYPNPNGTVSLDFDNDSNERVAIEIGNTSFSYYVKYNSQKPNFYDNISFNDKSILLLSEQIEAL